MIFLWTITCHNGINTRHDVVKMELWIGGSDIDDRQLQQLIVEIEVVREQLIQLSLQSGTIKDAKIIKKSEELDVLIVKYHKLQRASKKS
ncbi:hypothetical protein MALU111345_01080 [Marinicrinis lubricantis]